MSGKPSSLQHIKGALKNLRQALEEFEGTLVELEEDLSGEEAQHPRPQVPGGDNLELLTVPEVCQELGMGKSWVYRKLRSGEIPSVKLGRIIKVRRSDLQEYLEGLRYQPQEKERRTFSTYR